ncbi:response regulator [Aminobacter sp. AP02]|uniref:response regulator n=1 Tax=Aminobacter sp. AP02 TaxID=2135737 RepID=UPI000D6A9751|nr:response regulator [Aminobacter sp. AP02]PWK70753.1 response regulator receiver domain-containing protein [Aminobacter sp. AP02]
MTNCNIMVVEDEIFVATEIESMIEELGHRPVGIAMDSTSALDLAQHAEVALVDLNLRDGPTGPLLGRILAEKFGVTVLFMTANPSQLGDGVPGTIGVLPKPVIDDELRQAVRYAVARRHRLPAEPPARLKLFAADNSNDPEDGLEARA